MNWKESLEHFRDHPELAPDFKVADTSDFDEFDRLLKHLYAEFTFERAAEESQVPVDRIRETAEYVADCRRTARHAHLAKRLHRKPRRLAGRALPLLPERAHRKRGHARAAPR